MEKMEQLLDCLGAEYLIGSIIRAMPENELNEYAEFIARMEDIKLN